MKSRGPAVPKYLRGRTSVGVWRADDEADLRENVLGTLPLWPWMTAEITALQPHPNDPGPSGVTV